MGINAAQALSVLLTKRLEANIVVPASLQGKVKPPAGGPSTLEDFVVLLPEVIQCGLDDEREIPFSLQFMPQNKGAHLDQGQADMINRLLVDYTPGLYDEDVSWDVPTFFYNTGAVMVVRFTPRYLGMALFIIDENPGVLS